MENHCSSCRAEFSGPPRSPRKGEPGLKGRTYTSFAIILAIVGTAFAQQTPAERAHTESQRAAERIAALQRESDQLASHERTLLSELRKLEVDREIKTQQLAQVQGDRASVQKQIETAATRARDLQAEAERQRPDVDARLVQLYKMGRAGYWRLLLDVDNLREVARAYRTAAALGRIDRDRIAEHRRTLAALQTERAALQARASDLQKLELKDRRARAAVEEAVAAHNALVKSIDARRDLNAQLTGELQEAQRTLNASLAQLASGNTASIPALPLRPFQGALPWPADGVVSARFGRQTDRLGGAVVRSGIELSLAEGERIHAVHDGTVAYAAPFSGYGNLVIVDHGDRSYSLYGYLESIEVRKGDRVEPSTTVGLAGRDLQGNPSLYFELRVDGQAVDPLQWLKRR